jgi:tetratricopeptide (TPR) repeat protein
LALAGVAPFAKSPPLTDAAQVRIELGEAGALAANHDIAQAVAVYDKVLELDPSQPEALADGGWLVRLAGLSSKSARLVAGGDAEIAAAVKVAPGYALARAYDAIALYADRHLPDAAVHQLRAMLADHPSSTLLSSVRASAVATYRAAGIAVPTVLSSAKAP